MIVAPLLAAALAAQPSPAATPPSPPSSHTAYAESGPWQIIRQSVGCAAVVAYRQAADGGQRTLSLAWLVNNPDRRFVVLMQDTRWREPFETAGARYRLLYVGSGADPTPGSSPPPVEPLRVLSYMDGATGNLAILFDEAAAPAAVASFSRSAGFAVYRGRREISVDRLNGVAEALRLVAQCVATFPSAGQGAPPRP